MWEDGERGVFWRLVLSLGDKVCIEHFSLVPSRYKAPSICARFPVSCKQSLKGSKMDVFCLDSLVQGLQNIYTRCLTEPIRHHPLYIGISQDPSTVHE